MREPGWLFFVARFGRQIQPWLRAGLAILRLKSCAGCGAPFVICASCDRGHRYCGNECRRAARALSLRRARQVYERTDQARLDRRDRQRQYRRRKTVTDQSSQAGESTCTLPSPEVRHADRRVTTPVPLRCIICGRADTHMEPWTERIPSWSDARWP